jgi:hypothetical protein
MSHHAQIDKQSDHSYQNDEHQGKKDLLHHLEEQPSGNDRDNNERNVLDLHHPGHADTTCGIDDELTSTSTAQTEEPIPAEFESSHGKNGLSNNI